SRVLGAAEASERRGDSSTAVRVPAVSELVAERADLSPGPGLGRLAGGVATLGLPDVRRAAGAAGRHAARTAAAPADPVVRGPGWAVGPRGPDALAALVLPVSLHAAGCWLGHDLAAAAGAAGRSAERLPADRGEHVFLERRAEVQRQLRGRDSP